MSAADVAVTPFGCMATDEALGRRPMVPEGDGLEIVLLLNLDLGWPTVDTFAVTTVNTVIDMVATDEVLGKKRLHYMNMEWLL